MSRGFLSGVAAGAIVSVVGLAGLSVMVGPGGETASGTVSPNSTVPEISETPLDTAPRVSTPKEADAAPLEQTREAGETEADAAPLDAKDETGEGAADAPGNETPDAVVDADPDALQRDVPQPDDMMELGEEETAAPEAASPPASEPASEPAPHIAVAEEDAPVLADAPEAEASPAETKNDAPAEQPKNVAPTAPKQITLDERPIAIPAGPAAEAEEQAPEAVAPGEDAPARLVQVTPRPKLPQITPVPGAEGAVEERAPKVVPPAPQTEPKQGAKPAHAPQIKGDPVAPIGDLAPNVTTNRLPRIGANTNDTPAASGDPAPATSADGAQVSRAIQRNAVAFDAVPDLPMMAVLLRDEGADRAALGDISALPFPVTFVVDATAPDAEEAIAFYRAAGAEVVVEVNLPPKATPEDAEVNFQVQAGAMDDATAVMMSDATGFQEDSALALQVAEILKESGHGIVSFPKGLSTGHRLAVKSGVPAGLVFRDVDGAGQDGRAIRRFLDNAAFKARQKNGVIVYGHARAQTLQALIEWSLGNRAKSVSVAPISAVLLNQ